MTYKELGATGLKVSEIGLGCEGFLEKDDAFTQDMFALALEQGVPAAHAKSAARSA